MRRKLIGLLLALSLVLLVPLGARAAENAPWVQDEAVLLQPEEQQALGAMAGEISERFGVGVYVVTIPDYRDYDPAGAYEAAYGIYHSQNLGFGAQRDGILLMLSMAERDYALFCYGKTAQYAFSDYAMEQLEGEFLDNFRGNDWFGGFSDYFQTCGSYLAQAQAGKPVRESILPRILLFNGIALVIALLVCAVLVAQMKSVRKGSTAACYAGQLHLTDHRDHFTHRTETRRKIQRSDSSGSQSHSGGGGSGRSGKF